jgi:hypothetical protein
MLLKPRQSNHARLLLPRARTPSAHKSYGRCGQRYNYWPPKPAPGTTVESLSRALLFQRDSNPRPIGYKPIALPTEPWKVEQAVRIELTTSSLLGLALYL